MSFTSGAHRGAESSAQGAHANGLLSLGGMVFDISDLDDAIHESGLASEYELAPEEQRYLAAQAMALVSHALGCVSQDQFEASLAEFRTPGSVAGVAFLFGYAEHVRQELVEAFAETEPTVDLRVHLRDRLVRARELCLIALRQGA